MTHYKRRKQIIRFFDDAIHYRDDDCLLWPFGCDNKGYPCMYIHGKPERVGRAICDEVYGSPPTSEHQAAHSPQCVSRRCINPKHLRWATPKENSNDTILRHGRYCSAKLTSDEVLKIRELSKTLTSKEIARQVGRNVRTISDIINDNSWGWVVNPDFKYTGKDLFA